ncbi:MAG: RNA polymerase sigma factor [Chloroflexi bacterium]|nr:RNA polymerase sigma factor [Chloroflexota bacterium]
MDRANPLRRQHAQLDDLDDAVGAKPASFEELYERHRSDVYRYLRAWGSSEDEAADLTAATFERAYRALAAPRPPQASRAWLVRIARNLAIDAARRRDAARRGLRFWPRGEVAPDPADLVIGDETDRLLARRVTTLPAAQREAIVLRFGGGLSAREIGQVLDRSEAAAHKLMNRALTALREAYRDDD